MGIVGATIVIAMLGYTAINSMIPVNSNLPVFSAPTNIYLKAIKSPDRGYVFASQSVKGGKGVPLTGARSPTFVVNKGNLVSIHLISEDLNTKDQASLHNINIDEFNVHSKNLHYFESQTITFLSDKQGEFHYYCTIHPEMGGMLEVQ